MKLEGTAAWGGERKRGCIVRTYLSSLEQIGFHLPVCIMLFVVAIIGNVLCSSVLKQPSCCFESWSKQKLEWLFIMGLGLWWAAYVLGLVDLGTPREC